MNRKTVVYDVISSPNDIYFEQMWASAWSLKKRNPDVYVVVLTDYETHSFLSSLVKMHCSDCIDEFHIVTFDTEYTNKEKSRWIKTKLRDLVSGDFLFVDTDTIITGDLAPLFSAPCPFVGMVLDNNCHSSVLYEYPIFQNMYVRPLREIYGDDFKETTDVYNSGVMLVRDTVEAYEFFYMWHNNWQKSRLKGECRDQLSLIKTLQDYPSSITKLPGRYNCQIRSSVQYLFDAVIVHTFCSQERSELSPIFNNDLYIEIKKEGCITDNIKDVIENCKRSFSSPSILSDKSMMRIKFEPTYALFARCLFATNGMEKRICKFLNFISRAILWFLRH